MRRLGENHRCSAILLCSIPKRFRADTVLLHQLLEMLAFQPAVPRGRGHVSRISAKGFPYVPYREISDESISGMAVRSATRVPVFSRVSEISSRIEEIVNLQRGTLSEYH